MSRTIPLVLATVLLGGCFSMVSVRLRHPTIGTTVQCGPYSYVPATQDVAVASMTRCIDDYQKQGYVRVPE